MILNYDSDKYVDLSRLDSVNFDDGGISLTWKMKQDSTEEVTRGVFRSIPRNKWLNESEAGESVICQIENAFREAVLKGEPLFDFDSVFSIIMEQPDNSDFLKSYNAFAKEWRKRTCLKK